MVNRFLNFKKMGIIPPEQLKDGWIQTRIEREEFLNRDYLFLQNKKGGLDVEIDGQKMGGVEAVAALPFDESLHLVRTALAGGEVKRAKRLMERYGVNPSPERTALVILCSEGPIEIATNGYNFELPNLTSIPNGRYRENGTRGKGDSFYLVGVGA